MTSDGPTILITDSDLADGDIERALVRERFGVDPVLENCRSEDDVVRAVARYDPDAIVSQWAPVTSRVLDAAPRCRVVARYGIGLDTIDTEAAAERGIPVRNVPHYCTEEVATHAVALALSLWRRLPQLDREVRNGHWNASAHAGQLSRLSEATVGIVGAGRIGLLVGRAMSAWGARVIVNDPVAEIHEFENVALDTLVAQADIISLHAPLTRDSHHLVDRAFLESARRRPVLVNTSRGGLVDLDEVASALADGRLRGAGLDVFEVEPLEPGHPIWESPDVVLTPHAAWCSSVAISELRRQTIQNVIDVLTAAPAEPLHEDPR
jgi:D-3-phosphoglycerate dehydrogenase